MLLTGFEYDQTAGSRGLVIIFFAPTPTHGALVVLCVLVVNVGLFTLAGCFFIFYFFLALFLAVSVPTTSIVDTRIVVLACITPQSLIMIHFLKNTSCTAYDGTIFEI